MPRMTKLEEARLIRNYFYQIQKNFGSSNIPSLTVKGIVTTPYAPGVPYKQQIKSDR